MCYNCGCRMPNNPMGKEENITNQTFDKAAEAMGLTAERSRQNALELLADVMASKEQSTDTNWRPPRKD